MGNSVNVELSPAAGKLPTERQVFKKIAWRLLPLITIAYIVNFLDRTNVAFAALTMNHDIGLSATAFGYGSGILFLGYCFFEVPSNIALYRFGARRWLARIMISWGIISMAMVFTVGPHSFYWLRFLLGVAEAGFFPGAAFYISVWFPAQYRAQIYAWFLIGIPASAFIGGPCASFLLELNGVMGLAGWKWLFLAEGLPALILGILYLIFLVDTPEQASWLTADEKEIVKQSLQGEHKERESRHLWASLKDSRVLLLALVQFTYTVGSYGVAIFLPLIIKSHHFTNFKVGFLSAIPNLIACIIMVLWAGVVDRSGRKIFNLALTCLLSALRIGACDLDTLIPYLVPGPDRRRGRNQYGSRHSMDDSNPFPLRHWRRWRARSDQFRGHDGWICWSFGHGIPERYDGIFQLPDCSRCPASSLLPPHLLFMLKVVIKKE